jgi:hypothetical protein
VFPEEELRQLIAFFLGISCDPAARKWCSLRRSCDS